MLDTSARRMRPHVRPLRLVALVCVLAAVALPGAAWADDPGTPSGVSAIQQYVEQVPTASGSSAPGVGEATTSRLSNDATSGLGSVPPATAAALAKIATSSVYGAPMGVSAEGNQPAVDGAVMVEGVSDERLVGLFLVLALTTVGALVLAGGRARP
jgi:hypothetical protein